MSLRTIPIEVPEQIADIYEKLRKLRPAISVEDIQNLIADKPCDCPGCQVIPMEKTFSYEAGLATVHSGDELWYPITPITITSVRVSAKTAPVNGTAFGAALIVDVNKNGTTIFTDQTHRPQIVSGDTTALAPSIDDDTSTINDYYSWDIDQIGDATPGSDVTITIGYLVDCSQGLPPTHVVGPPPVLGPCNGPDLPYKTGLQVWLNACSLGLSDGDQVSTWTDLSGHARHFTGFSITSKPVFNTNILNGFPGIRCDGGATMGGFTGPDLSGVMPSAATMFMVWKFFTGTWGSYVLFTSDTSGGNHHDQYYRWATDSNGYWSVFRTSRIAGYPNAAGAAAMPTTGSHYLSLVSDASTYHAYIDGNDATAQTAAYEAPSSPQLGYYNTGTWNANFNGWLCEFILFDSGLSDPNRVLIENYLKTKYGL